MSSEEQTTLVKNLQLDDGSDSKDDEEVVSKYFAKKDKIGPEYSAQSPGTKESEIGKELSKSEKHKGKNCKKVYEKSTPTKKKNPKAMEKSMSENIKQSIKTEEESAEKGDNNNVQSAQPFDIDVEAYTAADTEMASTEAEIDSNITEKSMSENRKQSIKTEEESAEKGDNNNVKSAQPFDIDVETYTAADTEMASTEAEIDSNITEKSMSENRKQSIKTEEESAEKGDNNNVQSAQPFDIDVETYTAADTEMASTEAEIDGNISLNLENGDTDQKNETTESSDDKAQIEYTSGDFGSPESASDMERDTAEDMDIYQRNSQNEDEKKQKLASTDEIESTSQQTLDDNTNNEGGGKEDNKKDQKSKLRKRFSDRDTENYRNGYPGKEDNPELNDNLRFYKGEIPSTPNGALIDDIHKNWLGDYVLLERHHGYIQWLFPIRENGMNWQAQALQLHEAEAIKADPKAKERVLQSYRLILDFYGMNLVDEETGRLERSENWERCFSNLNWSSHNYLRITRILKCLGEFGYEHLKKGFIQFVLEEALEHKTLTRTLTSCRDYWVGTIKDDSDREELYNYIEDHEEGSSRVEPPREKKNDEAEEG